MSKGAPMGKRSQTYSKCYGLGYTRCTFSKSANSKSISKKALQDLDLNEVYSTSPQCSPTNFAEDIDYNKHKISS